MIRDLSGEFKSLSGDFHNQANLLIETNQMVQETKREISRLFAAFPNGDVDTHRINHEDQLEETKDRQSFRRTIRNGLVLFGIPAALVMVGTSIWEYIKVRMHQ